MTATTRVTGVTRGDGTEGGVEGKGEGGEEVEIVADGRADMAGSVKGPRVPKIFCSQIQNC